MLRLCLWLAFAIWQVVFRNVRDVPYMTVRITMYVGPPDALGAYEITTLEKEFAK